MYGLQVILWKVKEHQKETEKSLKNKHSRCTVDNGCFKRYIQTASLLWITESCGTCRCRFYSHKRRIQAWKFKGGKAYSFRPKAHRISRHRTHSPKNHKRDKSTYYDSYGNHDGENKYTVEERTIGDTGTQVDNCFVKNKTGLSLDFDGLLSAKLPFSIDKGINSPQVLIYHTHTSEAYLDEDVDFFYDSFYSRTNNNDFNVVAVGDALTEQLNKRGIKTVHDTTIHDESYNGSYDRSVTQCIKSWKYPDIKVVIDLHRDAIGTDENKVKPVFTYNGKKGAQIMILAGCDTDGERGFDCWEENLNFALKIQDKAETLYPDMTRPLNFDYFAYNEYVCNGSLLIEVGTESNSIDEATYSGSLLGNAIADVLLQQ